MSSRNPLHGTSARAAAVLALLPLLSQAPAAQGVDDAAPRARVDLRANTFSASSQDAAGLALAPSGRGVLVWQSRRQQGGTYGVYARRFGADGVWRGEETPVNAFTDGHQTDPVVALDDAGGAWFAWVSSGQDGDRGAVVARRFDARLAASPGEVLLTEGEESWRRGSQSEVGIACAPDGRAVAVWTSPGAEAGERAVVARRLDPDGALAGEVLAVSAASGMRDSLPRVAVDAQGRFVVVWARARVRGAPLSIVARSFGADGAPRGPEQVLSDGEGPLPIEPSLALARDGGSMVVAWLASHAEGYVPALRRLKWDDERGGFEGPPARELPTGAPGRTSGLEVALGSGGRCALVWGAVGSVEGADLFAREIEPDRQGELVAGPPFPATASTQGEQRLRLGAGGQRVALRGDGVLALAWSGDSGQGDASAANLTLLALDGTDLAGLEDLGPEPLAAPAAEDPAAALPHDPPVYQPLLAPSREALGKAAAAGAGPDYGFLGIADTGWNPPDPHLAVGPEHLVAVTNGAIAFFGRDGTLLQQKPIEGPAGFWGSMGAGTFVFDPEVAFDPYSNRFMAAAVERAPTAKPYFLLAVSHTADPQAGWHLYRIDVQSQAGGDTDIDSTVMGIDAQAVYLCADFFGPDKFLILILEKGALLAGQAPLMRHLLLSGPQSFGVPVTYGPTQFLVHAYETSPSDMLRLHAINDPLGSPQLSTFDLQVPPYTQPEDPPQLGTSSRPDIFEARVWSSVHRAGSLWVTHHVGSSRVVQRWYEIRMNGWPSGGTPTLVQHGDVDLGPDVRTFFGSLWVDALGNMAIAYARSSPSEYISLARSWRMAGDPPGTLRPSEILQVSTGPELTGRWGDYSAVGCDPAAPGVFWAVGQFRAADWGTWIATFGPCAMPKVYCTAKTSSLGLQPRIGWSGKSSLAAGSFRLTLRDAAPNQPAVYFESTAPSATQLLGGTLCVSPPMLRSAPFLTSPLGNVNALVGIEPENLGSTRFYQFWFRDPLHPDGSLTGLSDGLEVTVCP